MIVYEERSRKDVEKEKFNSIVDKIVANLDNVGLVTELAGQLKEDFGQFATVHETLSSKVGEHEAKIDELQKYNLELYLKTGQKVETQTLNDPEPLKFEDLITELEGGSK